MPFVRRRVKSNEIVYVTNVDKNVVFYLNIHVLLFVDDYFLVDCIGMIDDFIKYGLISLVFSAAGGVSFLKQFFAFLFIYIDVANHVTEEIVQLVPTLVLTNYLVFVGLK